MTINVTVIIRTTGEKSKLKLLKRTISSLAKQRYKSFDVVVVTCRNKELIERLLKEKLPQHKHKVIISPIRNRCFQSNIGIKFTNSEYVAIIDDDMLLSPNWLEELILVLAHSPLDVACVCTPVLNLYKVGKVRDNTHVNNLMSKIRSFVKYLSISYTFWRRKIRIINRSLIEIPTIPSNCMLCRRKALIEAGFYDVTMQEPLRGDDYDLGFRLRNLGYKILAYNGARAIHLENYHCKLMKLDHRSYENMLSTEFYIYSKHKMRIGLKIIMLQALYRLIESFYWALRKRDVIMVLYSFRGIIKGLIQGLCNVQR